jgi:antitoxin YefM
MPIETTYTQARAELARLLDRAGEDREVVLIQRRGHAPVALVAADELESLLETAHLLRSPLNARRLLSALRRALSKTGRPQTVASLSRELGLAEAR